MDYQQIWIYSLSLAITTGLLLQILGWLGLVLFWCRKIPPLPKNQVLPGVTIIKPCVANFDHEEENFDSFFHQDYPGKIQILFTVSKETDSIVPIIRQYLTRYPKVDAELIISTTQRAYWRKVDAMFDAHQKVKHPLVIWSDSDAIVKQNYISQMVSCLLEPGVSMVTTPQYDYRMNNFATALKGLGNNCDVASYVMCFYLLIKNHKVAWGHSMGFKQKVFREIETEAWDLLSHSFGDDLMMPALFHKKGKKVVFRNIFCPIQYSDKSLSQVIQQQERFALCQKAYLGKWTCIFGLLGFPMIPATLLLITVPQHPIVIPLFIITIFIRLFLSMSFEKLILNSITTNLYYFWTIPIWDLMHIYFVIHAFFQNQVIYHGISYRFIDQFQLEKIETEWTQQGNDEARFQTPL